MRAILYHWQLGLCDDIQVMKSAQGLYAPWAVALTASRLCLDSPSESKQRAVYIKRRELITQACKLE